MSGDGFRRWIAAERDGRDDEADVALGAAFNAVPRRAPGAEFSARVADAVARAAARRAYLVRAAWAAVFVSGVLLTAAGLMLLPRLLRPMLGAAIGGLVWSVNAVDRGLDVWSILARFARAVGSLVVAPQVKLVLMALGLVAIAALYGLNRVLELEERSS